MGSEEQGRTILVSSNFGVRFMEEDDILQVCDIEKQSFSSPWSEFAFKSELQDNKLASSCVTYPLNEESKVVGYGGLWVILDEAHITNIAITPEFRGQKIGEFLLSNMMDIARTKGAQRITLEVRVSNFIAQKLYERLGFASAGLRKGYYTDNHEDAVIMWCDL